MSSKDNLLMHNFPYAFSNNFTPYLALTALIVFTQFPDIKPQLFSYLYTVVWPLLEPLTPSETSFLFSQPTLSCDRRNNPNLALDSKAHSHVSLTSLSASRSSPDLLTGLPSCFMAPISFLPLLDFSYWRQ